MKMPRRETQIFSLSMMDVISGAMGAFLIIMVILMRYYKEDEDIAAQREQLEQRLADLQQQVDDARQQLLLTTELDVEDLLRRLELMRSQLASVQRKASHLSNDLQAARQHADQLRRHNDQLTGENTDLNQRLRFRQPFLVVANWQSANVVDVNVTLEASIRNDKGQILYSDPRSAQQRAFEGDFRLNGTGTAGTDIWVARDTQPDAVFKVYVSLHKEDQPLSPTAVTVVARGTDLFHPFTPVELTPQKTWELVGTVKIDASGKASAQTASEQERLADRDEVAKRLSREPGKVG